MNEHLIINKIPVIGALNAVEGFNPSEFLSKAVPESNEDNMRLNVEYRKLWFRLKYPLGKITKTIMQLSEQVAIVETRVYINREDGVNDYVANAFAQINYDQSDDSGKHNCLETAEILATGQALADAGFGVQLCDFTGNISPEISGSGVPASQPAVQSQPATQDQHETNLNTKEQSANPADTQQQTEKSDETSNPAQKQPEQEPPKQQYDSTTPVEEIVKVMTLEEAKSITVPQGLHRGKSLGQLAIEKPSALEWYIKSYNGNDNTLRAGATVLIDAAMNQAG